MEGGRVLDQVRPDDRHQDEEDDEDAPADRDLVAAEPHPRDLPQGASLDGGTADSLKDRLRGGGLGRQFEWRGHRQATLLAYGDGNCPAVAWPGQLARPLPENVSAAPTAPEGRLGRSWIVT